ncbi:MAG: polyprenyl synthetase family protein [Mycobacteriales bacterium]
MTSSPLDRADLRGRVHKALAAYLSTQAPRLEAVAETLGPVQEALSDFLLTGGKRMRPAFCYWGFRAAGGQDSDESIAASASLELLQACALIHDDVMDGSDTRRGQPAMHRRFSGMHRSNGWQGDPEAFGMSAAVLLGDLCLIWADEVLNTSGMPTDALLRAQPVYDEMRVELMAGQYLDLLEQAMGGGTVDSALRVARYKSAKYTIEKPLHMGAVLAGGDDLLLASLTAYGLPLGEAFQLRDDVLGVFGDPSETGKPAGDDLREGKRTVLVALARQKLSTQARSLMDELLGDPELDESQVNIMRNTLRECGAVEQVERIIDHNVGLAKEALRDAPLAASARAQLLELADTVTRRAY